ncbi:hypothetical protein [Streptomyces sp. NPDC001222]|uniref:hypothetical protein n=1 Tax=Streptomyces sp. NPDC001222 TaxID=3364548 RepID=UPI0036917FD0
MTFDDPMPNAEAPEKNGSGQTDERSPDDQNGHVVVPAIFHRVFSSAVSIFVTRRPRASVARALFFCHAVPSDTQ